MPVTPDERRIARASPGGTPGFKEAVSNVLSKISFIRKEAGERIGDLFIYTNPQTMEPQYILGPAEKVTGKLSELFEGKINVPDTNGPMKEVYKKTGDQVLRIGRIFAVNSDITKEVAKLIRVYFGQEALEEAIRGNFWLYVRT